jgi:hypothetical protein
VGTSFVFAASAALVAVAGASAQSINFQINPQTSPTTTVGGGIDVGHPVTREQITALSAAGLFSKEDRDALLAQALAPTDAAPRRD